MIRVGIAGIGAIANTYISLITTGKIICELTAISSRNPEHLQAVKSQYNLTATCFTSYSEMAKVLNGKYLWKMMLYYKCNLQEMQPVNLLHQVENFPALMEFPLPDNTQQQAMIVNNFLESIQNSHTPACTIEEAMQSLIVINAAYLSWWENKNNLTLLQNVRLFFYSGSFLASISGFAL